MQPKHAVVGRRSKKAYEIERAGVCGDDARRAIARALEDDPEMNYEVVEQQIVRMARLAAFHYFRAFPSQKEPDRYELAQREYAGKAFPWLDSRRAIFGH